jgi:ABC-type transporter Mla subunit MlaD
VGDIAEKLAQFKDNIAKINPYAEQFTQHLRTFATLLQQGTNEAKEFVEGLGRTKVPLSQVTKDFHLAATDLKKSVEDLKKMIQDAAPAFQQVEADKDKLAQFNTAMDGLLKNLKAFDSSLEDGTARSAKFKVCMEQLDQALTDFIEVIKVKVQKVP